jgi:hypothetical protein
VRRRSAIERPLAAQESTRRINNARRRIVELWKKPAAIDYIRGT